MCGGKKGATTTTTSQTQASPEAMAAYRDILGRATTQADVPYQAYTGDRVADFSPDQQAAFQATRDAQGIASPFLSEATGMARAGAAPIDPAAIARYQNPYQSTVIDATMRDLQNQNAIAQSQVTGNAALRGALGGSRVGVAQALTAGEQARTQASTLAGLYSSGYDKALAAAQQDRAASSSGASLMAGLGDASSTAAYRDIASQYGMGQQQQGNQQAGLDTAYQQWLQEKAYPTQQISWLSDVAGRAGAGMGTSTSGTSTAPPPNPYSALLGVGTTLAGAALGSPWLGSALGATTMAGTAGGGTVGRMDGGVVPSYAAGGVVKGYKDGDVVDGSDSMYGAPSEQPLLDLSLDPSGAYSMDGTGGEELAGMAGTPSGGFNWQSLGNPLMQAGFKMMASQSPYLGVAIGEGGLAGTKAYADNAKVDADKKHKEELIAVQRERLAASLKAQQAKSEQERWHPLGASNDPDKPGYWMYDRNTGETVLKDARVTPRAGAAGGRPPVYEIRRKAWLDLYPGDERGALDYADGKRGMTEADAHKAASMEAGRNARALLGLDKLDAASFPDYVARETERLKSSYMSSGVRPATPPAATGAPGATRSMAPADPAVAGLDRFSGPAGAAATYSRIPAPPPRPGDVPRGTPMPLPREAPAAPVVPASPRIMSAPPKKSDGSSYSRDELISLLHRNIERAAGNTLKINELMKQAREWGIAN